MQQSSEQLMHIDRLNMMGEMAIDIAHELNQPLTAITTYAQASSRLLDQNLKNASDLEHALTKINEQARRAGEVIQRLRAMVKKQDQHYERVDINKLILDNVELSRIYTDEHNVQITTQLASSLPTVDIDFFKYSRLL